MSRATAFKDRMEYQTSAVKSSQSPGQARLPKLDLDAAQDPKLPPSAIPNRLDQGPPSTTLAAPVPLPKAPVREGAKAGDGQIEASGGRASVEAARILAARLPARGDEASRVPMLKLPRQDLEVEIPERHPLSPVQAHSPTQGATAPSGKPQTISPPRSILGGWL